ncbi:hypothetical protein JY651_23485 [Pyxidicoccus parkwayensis]|uniref:Uncharacterized protein n=1 Tax=Pyxidicoccus parkwayensis TaxID=2813578 RepID=A0ABX7PBA1_9BACT|nr:hypothetical protein [Pyxidicoccus parkwaysis]QSQ27688.1 hypothetical protein JY651_23485 [Pyxidicoccus parkwaysis]
MRTFLKWVSGALLPLLLVMQLALPADAEARGRNRKRNRASPAAKILRPPGCQQLTEEQTEQLLEMLKKTEEALYALYQQTNSDLINPGVVWTAVGLLVEKLNTIRGGVPASLGARLNVWFTVALLINDMNAAQLDLLHDAIQDDLLRFGYDLATSDQLASEFVSYWRYNNPLTSWEGNAARWVFDVIFGQKPYCWMVPSHRPRLPTSNLDGSPINIPWFNGNDPGSDNVERVPRPGDGGGGCAGWTDWGDNPQDHLGNETHGGCTDIITVTGQDPGNDNGGSPSGPPDGSSNPDPRNPNSGPGDNGNNGNNGGDNGGTDPGSHIDRNGNGVPDDWEGEPWGGGGRPPQGWGFGDGMCMTSQFPAGAPPWVNCGGGGGYFY